MIKVKYFSASHETLEDSRISSMEVLRQRALDKLNEDVEISSNIVSITESVFSKEMRITGCDWYSHGITLIVYYYASTNKRSVNFEIK